MTPEELYATIQSTWPPKSTFEADGWTIRDGAGGGKRVEAATALTAAPDIAAAETAMDELGQTALFMIRDGDTALDQRLADRGYQVIDPVHLYAAAPSRLVQDIPPVTAFTTSEPLAIMAEIWAGGGIGPARLEVMERVTGPKTYLFGRINDRPAGAGFVAISNSIAMVHALEIRGSFRRKGLARHMMAKAAQWAQDNDGKRIALAVTKANAPANALYTSLGMTVVGQYHYRIKQPGGPA